MKKRKRKEGAFLLADWLDKAAALRFLFSVGLPDNTTLLLVQKILLHEALPLEHVLPPCRFLYFRHCLPTLSRQHTLFCSLLWPCWFVFQG